MTWAIIIALAASIIWKAGWLLEKWHDAHITRQLLKQKAAAEQEQEEKRARREEFLRRSFVCRRCRPVDPDIKDMLRDVEKGLV